MNLTEEMQQYRNIVTEIKWPFHSQKTDTSLTNDAVEDSISSEEIDPLVADIQAREKRYRDQQVALATKKFDFRGDPTDPVVIDTKNKEQEYRDSRPNYRGRKSFWKES